MERLVSAVGRAGDRDQMLDAERLQQVFLSSDDVGDRDRREIGAVGLAGRRVHAGGVGRTVGRSEHIAGDDEQPVGVDRLARPDQPVPAARLPAIRGIAPGRVVAAGEAVRDEHRVAAVRREPAVGLVGDCRLRQHRAVGQSKIADREKPVLDDADISGAAIAGPRQRCVVHDNLLRPRLPGLCLQLLPLSSLAGICSGFGGGPTICKPRLSCFAGWLNLQQICSEISRVSCTGASDPGESGAVPRHQQKGRVGENGGRRWCLRWRFPPVSSDRITFFPRRKNGAVRLKVTRECGGICVDIRRAGQPSECGSGGPIGGIPRPGIGLWCGCERSRRPLPR